MRQAATYPITLARLWIDRLRNAQADHHAIAQGMIWVALFVLLTSLARAAREMAIAYRYGVGAEVDAYLFVFNLVSWPAGGRRPRHLSARGWRAGEPGRVGVGAPHD